MSGLAWLLALGATWRITLLLIADEITRPARDRLIRWFSAEVHYVLERAPRERAPRMAYLLSCPWCASVWVAPVVVGSGLAWADGWGWQLAAGSLAASAAVGFLSAFASPDG